VTPLGGDRWVGQFFSLSLSPDGKQIVATLTSGTRQDVWTRSLETGTLNRLTFERDGSLNYRAKWTADGRALTFLSNRAGVAGELWKQPSDGSAPAERLASDGPLVDEGFVSPDGLWAVYRAGGSELVGRDIKGLRIGSGTSQSLVATSAEEYSPTLSPDGRWLAYVSNESGVAQVYVRPFPQTQAAVWQLSTSGGHGPVWARSGQELFYQNARNELVAVETRGGATLTRSSSRRLFDLSEYQLNPWHPTYDVAGDGERFLMARRIGDPSTELVLTQNWFHEVKQVLQGRR
jgi:Tol biopolymer transport system component